MKKIFSLTNLTLLVALSLSAVAAYYSIIGLTAIFAGAVIPVIIMGSILEVGKITTTVWLKKYWDRASWVLKLYLVPAVFALAVITSMGIFGFLSKAHMEQGVTSGDSQSKVAIYDEKIKTAKENIEANRKALKQMDEAVDQVMGRSTDEKGADKAVSIRRAQQKERSRLLSEIEAEQKKVASLSEERAPIASELRKIEAEVGPIKYIAALIYGDNTDANMLEAAVRWVIILLVIVFDPLAIALVLAANQSKEWDKEQPAYEQDDGPLTTGQLEQIKATVEDTPDIDEGNRLIDEIEKEVPEVIIPQEPMKFKDPGEHPDDYDETAIEEPVKVEEKTLAELHPYLNNGFAHFQGLTPMVYKPEVKVELEPEVVEPTIKEPIEINEEELNATELSAASEVKISAPAYKEIDGGYVIYDGKMISKDALKELQPQLFRLTADTTTPVTTNFGSQFPRVANKGDVFIRVDVLPNRVFRFDGRRWFEVNKDAVNSYLDEDYIKFLVDKIDSGEYDVELLSEKEKSEIESYLNSSK